jgi:hypothetical protein
LYNDAEFKEGRKLDRLGRLKIGRPPQATTPLLSRRHAAAGFFLSLGCAFFAYAPALNGPFVFDDFALPFRFAGFSSDSFAAWVSSVRPVLMASYWVNFQMSGQDSTLSYHLLNLLIHCVNSVLAGVVLWKILQLASEPGRRSALLAVMGAGVFLLHPLQAESVAYIAGRSESLSAFFSLCAFTVFLFTRSRGITWRAAVAVVALFIVAAGTKEHAVALAAVIVLTDLFFTNGSLPVAVQRNWRLYALLAVGCIIAVAGALRVLSTATTAGFRVEGVTWKEYALTQPQVLLLYLKLFLFPVGLTVDHDFEVSRSVFDLRVLLSVLVWVVGVVLSIRSRHSRPVLGYGLLLFLLFLAPTSSFIPIRDVAAERRMYLPVLGLLLMVLDVIHHSTVRSRSVQSWGLGFPFCCCWAAVPTSAQSRGVTASGYGRAP